MSPAGREGGFALVLLAANTDVQRLVEGGLGPQHVGISRVADGDQTLAMARDRQPDLIVVSVDSGDIEGIRIARELKRDATTASIPVLAIMGRFCPDDLRGRAEGAGFHALLLQPITATTLAQVAGLLIERASLVRQRAAKRRMTATVTAPRAAPSPHHDLGTTEQRATLAQTSPPAPVVPRCRHCGNNADTQLLRTTGAYFSYRCGVCEGQWRSARPGVMPQDGARPPVACRGGIGVTVSPHRERVV